MIQEQQIVKEVLKDAHTIPAPLVIVIATTMQTSMQVQCAVHVEVVLQRVDLLQDCRRVHLQLNIHGCSGQQDVIFLHQHKSELIQANMKQNALIWTLVEN